VFSHSYPSIIKKRELKYQIEEVLATGGSAEPRLFQTVVENLFRPRWRLHGTDTFAARGFSEWPILHPKGSRYLERCAPAKHHRSIG